MICYYDVLTDLGHCFRSAIGSLLLPLLSCGYILADVLRHRSCPNGPIAQAYLWSLPPCYLSWLSISPQLFLLVHSSLPSSCVSQLNRCCSYHPFRSAHASAVWLVPFCLNIRSMVGVPSRSFSSLLDSRGMPFSFQFLYRHCADALCKFYFFISILILALYSFILREVTKREPVLNSGSSVDCLPALDNDFSMNLPFSLPTESLPAAINKTCIHR